MDGIVDDGSNKELPIAMNKHKYGFTNPTELPPEIITYWVEDAVGDHSGNGPIICFVTDEACLAHDAKVIIALGLLSDTKYLILI
jgi:hypothetical protein